eukprot:scaffold10736_cov70-Phaeocystis_antarctica.AAC.3
MTGVRPAVRAKRDAKYGTRGRDGTADGRGGAGVDTEENTKHEYLLESPAPMTGVLLAKPYFRSSATH